MRRVGEDFPEWVLDRPELHEIQRRLARDSFLAEIAALRHGAQVPEDCPLQDLEYARTAARLGAPRDIITYPYRLGQQVQWQEWLDLVEEAGLERDVRRALLDRGSRFFFSYANRISEFVAEEFARERERMLRGEEERRRHAVAEILTGADVSSDALGYHLDGWHVGLVVEGPASARVISELAQVADRRPLRVSMPGQTWGWLGGASPLGDLARQALGEHRTPTDAPSRSEPTSTGSRASGVLIGRPATPCERPCGNADDPLTSTRSPWRRSPHATSRPPGSSWCANWPASQGPIRAAGA